MFSKVISAAIRGISIELIHVETDIGDGLPAFDMVGLLSSEVRESRERVRTSIKNSGRKIPPKRITVNLSPAAIRKEGGLYDLPIAVGILMALQIIKQTFNMKETLIVGELGLDGSVHSVCGVLPIILEGKAQGIKNFIVPKANVKEGAIIEGVQVFGVESLEETEKILNGILWVKPEYKDIREVYKQNRREEKQPDFSEINGQENLKRAAEIAAAGMHNMLMIGPPGSGKSMLAARIPSILPEPDLNECIEITKIYSIAGLLGDKSLITKRPFRAPHHTITEKALIGGGNRVKAGEITLAHKGVLFLDEFAEFKRDTIEALRQPVENGSITISRIYGVCRFPAKFMIVAAANPCKCGYYPDRSRCCCSEHEVHKYISRLNGPMIDRMDLCVGVLPVDAKELISNKKAENSEQIRKRVAAAVRIQKERCQGKSFRFNSELSVDEIQNCCRIGKKEQSLLFQALETFRMSARGYYKIIRVARTIADLEESACIREEHISEALGFRMVL